jgi:hypothetical protein
VETFGEVSLILFIFSPQSVKLGYRLTSKGVQVALLFLFFHKRLCGPLANSRFHHRPDPQHRPNSRLEAAYHRADKAIENVVQLLAVA